MDANSSYGRPRTRLSVEQSARRPPNPPVSYSRQDSGSNSRPVDSEDDSDVDQLAPQSSSRFDVSNDRTRPTGEPPSQRGSRSSRRESNNPRNDRDGPYTPRTARGETPSNQHPSDNGRATDEYRGHSEAASRSPHPQLENSANRRLAFSLAPDESNGRYPAYDSRSRRIGLDHVRANGEPPEPERQQGQGDTMAYYRPKTQKYPTVTAEVPHVMEMSLNSPVPFLPVPMSSTLQHTFHVSGGMMGRNQQNGQAVDMPPKKKKQGGIPVTDYAATDDIPDATEDVRRLLGFGPRVPVHLDSLEDVPEGEKPPYSYPALIQLAIIGSERKRLTLQGIYTAIEERFPFFRTFPESAWQSTIRHTLSLKSCFRSVDRPITEPGKGNYWVVDYSFGDGNKRTRKRNPRPKKADRDKRMVVARREEEEESTTDDDDDEEEEYDEPLASRFYNDDPNIDPQLRNQGRFTGDGRHRSGAGSSSRSKGKRAHSPGGPSQGQHASKAPRGGHTSMYYDSGPPDSPSPSPPSSQLVLGSSIAQSASRATFGQPSFPTSANARLAPTWAQYGSAAPLPYTGPTVSSARDQPGSSRSGSAAALSSNQAHQIRNAAIVRPTPRTGVEVFDDPEGLPTARRVGITTSSGRTSRPPAAWNASTVRPAKRRTHE
ncbi:hypothetical protein NLI96_g1105 [Meripilus lineatus]|uniref:Fork-head domain-containing protein n=1 Tax=Meripilus lineatus TaxID=2056292 RepID=A0AAD5VBE2_9APHY|nr:hypothetical protein NLI96_g1105 [Physisporinus lineatus]